MHIASAHTYAAGNKRKQSDPDDGADAAPAKCACCQHSGSPLEEIDDAFIGMDTKASTGQTRFHFHHGISNKTFLNAKHIIPMLQQMQVVLGVSTYFLPAPVLQAVHELIADVIWIDSELHRRSHSDSTATALQRKLCDWLKKCKRVFTCTYEEDEDFGFMKFHFAAMHMYWLITEFGPLWTTCTAHMEELHKVVT
jgi:hypothetical protein